LLKIFHFSFFILQFEFFNSVFTPGNRLPCHICFVSPQLLGKRSKFILVQKSLAIDSALSDVSTSIDHYRVQVIPGQALDSALLDDWRAVQQSNPALQNPCFAPEFTQAVATARNDVEVGIVEEHGKVIAIFPFQRKAGGRAIPVGGIVSDYQGLICRPDFSCDPRALLKACGLISWDFDRLLATQQPFKPFHKLCEPSALIDLSQGYEAYVAERRAAGTEQIKKCMNLMRRLELEVGPIRFVPRSPDPSALTKVLAWKSQQYRKTGWRDLFALKWGRSLVEQIRATQSESFAGMLSLLYAGENLVAGHLGMRSRSVWHYWFPAYDPRFAKYSPGLILLLKMAEHAPQIGLRTIDLGTGLTLYKRRLMNASISVAEGSVERPSWLSFLRAARRKAKRLVHVRNG
jgi:CelD/BcsL family acetyltransferase involved in cellulose biosynthesis